MDQYRYEKHYLYTNSFSFKPVIEFFSVNKKALSGLTLVLGGVFILSYLTFYYSSYILATNDLGTTSPLVKAKNDFADYPQEVLGTSVETQLVYQNFTLSIPALKIKDAVVTTNVISDKKEDYLPVLEESIAHYKGTSLPGQKGDSFLYGHSVSPQFFNTNDYITIFSTLHKLKVGDQVSVKYGDKEFIYEVVGKEIVDPKDLDVIDKSGQGDKTMTLMTCSPPGVPLKRLLVSTKLVD